LADFVKHKRKHLILSAIVLFIHNNMQVLLKFEE